MVATDSNIGTIQLVPVTH